MTTRPDRAQQRCMIYRPKQRILEDSCIACNGSEIWCDSLAPDKKCCQMCSHTKSCGRVI